MQTTVYIIVIIWFGLLTLIPIVVSFLCFRSVLPSFSCHSITFKKSLKLILLFFICILITFSPAYCLIKTSKKFFSKPNPSNTIELFENGEKLIRYQDTTHFCNANEENSNCFTAKIPVYRTVSKNDTCIHCGKNFTYHNTLKEQNFFNLMEDISNASCYY